jgi:outer membrane protein OmpA-like peptidoglycan-associated protein
MIDTKENVVAKSKVSSPIFHFTYLPAEEHSLAKIYIEDTWVQVTNMGATGKKMLDTLKLIENIYFDYGKSEIGAEAKSTLNKAIIAMKNNLNLSIEIDAHTDSRGDALYNLTLSDKRANAAKDYLISQGINAKRIAAKGYGENKLLNKCKDGVECTEEEHSQNRRMEFKFKAK